MIINSSKVKLGVTEALALVLSLLYAIGIRRWFAVCPLMTETVMPCHWAGEMLKAISVLLLVLCALHLPIPDAKIKIGMDIALIGLALLGMFVPGTVIRICGGETMACKSAAHPWTLAFCGALAVILLADVIVYASALAKENHRRKDPK